MHCFAKSKLKICFAQILTQEDWHEVLYMGMANTSAWAALYFILLMTFGNYVLFNLLVAILVEGFSAQAEVDSYIAFLIQTHFVVFGNIRI